MLPHKLEFVFDGWSLNRTDYVCVFAPFPAKTSRQDFNDYSSHSYILRMKLNLRQRSMKNAFILFFVLANYGKSWGNVFCFISDTSSVIHKLSDRIDLKMIGCQSHRFHLALQHVLINDNVLIKKVNVLMHNLK